MVVSPPTMGVGARSRCGCGCGCAFVLPCQGHSSEELARYVAAGLRPLDLQWTLRKAWPQRVFAVARRAYEALFVRIPNFDRRAVGLVHGSGGFGGPLTGTPFAGMTPGASPGLTPYDAQCHALLGSVPLLTPRACVPRYALTPQQLWHSSDTCHARLHPLQRHARGCINPRVPPLGLPRTAI